MTLIEAAHQAHQAGLSIIPIIENKKPSIRWAEYQQHRPSIQRLNHWLRTQPAGIAVLGGTISGNLEILDFDDPTAWTQFANNPPPNIAPLIEHIRNGYEEETPKGGRHLLYRITDKPVPGNTKLAADQNGQPRIETRGEGGYAVVAPSSGTAHPNGQPWTLHRGNFNQIVTITANQHNQLMAYCATFNTPTATEQTPRQPATPPTQDRPGDQWNRTCTIEQYATILATDGWHVLPHTVNSERVHLVRPGKDPTEGPSANLRTDTDGITKLYVHSTNAPIPANQPGQAYTPFSYLTTTRGGPTQAIQWLRTNSHLDTKNQWDPFTQDPPPEPTPDHIKVRSITEAINDTTPSPPELVAGLIRQGESTIIGAPRGIGKSFLGMQLALMLATGQGHLFDRHQILRPCRTLYCHGELDPYSARDRWRRMLTSPTWNITAGTATPPEGLYETFSQWRIDLRKTRTTTTTNGITTTTETTIATINPHLETQIVTDHIQILILDPWASYHGGSENSNDDTEAVLSELRRVSLTHGTTIIIIAHFGKNTDTRDPEDLWRGASRLPDWASNRITLTEHYTKRQRADLQLTRKQARRYLNVTYLRRGAPLDDHSIHRDTDGFWHDWQDTDTTGGRPAEHTATDLLQALADNGGEFASKSEAADALGVHRDTIDRLIEEAGNSIEIVHGARNSQTIRTSRRVATRPLSELPETTCRNDLPETPPAGQNRRSDPKNDLPETPPAGNPPAGALTCENDLPETSFPTGTRPPPPKRQGGGSSTTPDDTTTENKTEPVTELEPEPEGGTTL